MQDRGLLHAELLATGRQKQHRSGVGCHPPAVPLRVRQLDQVANPPRYMRPHTHSIGTTTSFAAFAAAKAEESAKRRSRVRGMVGQTLVRGLSKGLLWVAKVNRAIKMVPEAFESCSSISALAQTASCCLKGGNAMRFSSVFRPGRGQYGSK